MELDARPGLAPGREGLQPSDSTPHLSRVVEWVPRPVLPRLRFVHNEECCCYTSEGGKAWCGMPDSNRHDKLGRIACCALHQCRIEKRPLELGSHQSVRSFSPPLICLSHPAFLKGVPPRGDAPRSAGYRPAALLLSYGGMKFSSAVPAEFEEAVQRTAPRA